MKKSFVLMVVLIFTTCSLASANSWEWWAPAAPSGQQATPPTLFWPDSSFKPTPSPSPKPTPPIEAEKPVQPTKPIQPIQPSPPQDKVPLPGSSLNADEQYILNSVNQERLKMGLQALQLDYGLVALAKEKSYDMAAYNYFSHVSPRLGTVYTMLDGAAISYSRAGENIARAGSVARAHTLFMGSPDHRVNILYSGYTHLGVGVLKYGTSYYVTQIFIRK